MRPNARMQQPAGRRGDTSEEQTVRLPDARGGSWPTGTMPAIGRPRHHAVRPIERPPRLRAVPSGITPAVARPVRRGGRVLIVVLCLIIGLTAAALVAQGVLLALGRPLL